MPNPHNQSAKIPMRIRVLFFALSLFVMAGVFLLIAYLLSGTASNSVEQTPQMARSMPNVTNKKEVDTDTDVVENLDYTPDALTTGIEDLPRSLQGTQVDGDIIVDAQSELIVTRGLRRLFDYFLSAQGEEDSASINRRVESYISSRTPEPAASHATQLYYQYLAYLQQVARIESKYSSMSATLIDSNNQVGKLDLAVIEKQQQEIKKLRAQLFNLQTEVAFFSDDDALSDYNLAILQIAQDKSLTQSQKQQAQQTYIEQLPDSLLKEQAKHQAKIEQLVTRTQQMQGSSKDELFAMRAETVGEDAAKRLAEMDAQNAEFEARFVKYQQARDKILDSSASAQSQQQQISELQHQLFSKTEQKRLAGYEQFKQQYSHSHIKEIQR